MEITKSIDGYKVYKINKDDKEYYLANKDDYKKDIDLLLETIDDLSYDSIIFMFGLDTGEYIPFLEEVMCSKNRVIIFEPNEDVYNENVDKVKDIENILILNFSEELVSSILYGIISCKNFNNLYVHAFGNYKEIYEDEYNFFISKLDNYYTNASSSIQCTDRFKTFFLENMLFNLKKINDSSPLNSFVDYNYNVPAIVVSAGPSLDKNIATMLENKDKLKQCVIIAGNRTLKPLTDNGIIPDLVVSIDPIDANYDMMKDYLDTKSFLAFYEYSNKKIVDEFKGEKIYISGFLSKIIEDMASLKGTYGGGSVAHTCIDIANIMGCNPIILAGQDLAHTFEKIHADLAVYEIDKINDKKKNNLMMTKDVYGNDVKTTTTLDKFKIRLEEYIEMSNKEKEIEFINCSYGADIKGCKHKELDEVLNSNIFKNKKKSLVADKNINIDYIEIKNSMCDFVNEFIQRSQEGIDLCMELSQVKEDKDLVEIDSEDMDLHKFLYIMNIVDDFEGNILANLLGGYYSIFLYDIKNESFKMLAKDFEKYTSNLRYQSKAFLNYFEKMNKMLVLVKENLDNIITEFY